MKGLNTAKLIDLALKLADESGPIVLNYFRKSLSVEFKSDDSPVTKADKEAESALRRLLSKETPNFGILGEEYGEERINSEYVWVIDPIDGTRAFINGIPLFGTLIALTHHGKPILGLVDHPALKERWLGVDGRPTLHWGRGDEGVPVKSRDCGTISKALLCASSPEMFSKNQLNQFNLVSDAARDTRCGTDCYGYSMLASGQTDLVVEAGMQPYDYLAHVVVVSGAGGKITDWEGKELTLNSSDTVVAAGSPKIHEQIIQLFSNSKAK